MGSGQEMGMQVCVRVWLLLFILRVYFKCVPFSLRLLSPSLCLCVYNEEQAKAPLSALSSPISTPPLLQRASPSLSVACPLLSAVCLCCFVYISVLASQRTAD